VYVGSGGGSGDRDEGVERGRDWSERKSGESETMTMSGAQTTEYSEILQEERERQLDLWET
jgi:hypothetical protein